jgi:GNAT superfamily N-acetyltransferase
MHEVAVWRSQLGEGAGFWSERGLHTVNPERWVALSGIPSTQLNVIACFSDELDVVRRSLIDITDLGAMGVIMLAGPALASAHVLVLAQWGCVGTTPMMHLGAEDVDQDVVDPAVRRLGAADIGAARDVVNDAYGDDVVGGPAIPDVLDDGPVGVWGLDLDGELSSVVVISLAGDSASIWFMATKRSCRRRGHGRRLLAATLAAVVSAGSDHILLYASPPAEPLYRQLGFSLVEYWQQWSRPRWSLPRA